MEMADFEMLYEAHDEARRKMFFAAVRVAEEYKAILMRFCEGDERKFGALEHEMLARYVKEYDVARLGVESTWKDLEEGMATAAGVASFGE